MLAGRLLTAHRDGLVRRDPCANICPRSCGNQLHEMGFRHMQAASLKPKHVDALVERWKAESLSAGTIKNRMTELRWWAEKIAKQNVIAKDNDQYGIPRRKYVTNVSQSRELTNGDPSFPRPRQLGSEFSIGWLRVEVMQWLTSRPLVELNGLDAVERRRRRQRSSE